MPLLNMHVHFFPHSEFSVPENSHFQFITILIDFQQKAQLKTPRFARSRRQEQQRGTSSSPVAMFICGISTVPSDGFGSDSGCLGHRIVTPADILSL